MLINRSIDYHGVIIGILMFTQDLSQCLSLNIDTKKQKKPLKFLQHHYNDSAGKFTGRR